jgi:hypothetical protein
VLRRRSTRNRWACSCGVPGDARPGTRTQPFGRGTGQRDPAGEVGLRLTKV